MTSRRLKGWDLRLIESNHRTETYSIETGTYSIQIPFEELYAINGRRPKNGPWNKFNLTKFIIDTDPEIKVGADKAGLEILEFYFRF